MSRQSVAGKAGTSLAAAATARLLRQRRVARRPCEQTHRHRRQSLVGSEELVIQYQRKADRCFLSPVVVAHLTRSSCRG